MSKDLKHGTFIHGIAASEHLDSSGERIIIKGVDISSLTKDGVINWEHKSDQASHIVGKILEAKKILKKEDCENEHHKYFWEKAKMPFIYIAAELFDHVGHSAAQDVAAMLKYDKNLNKDETKALINFSIEGSRLGKEGSNITKCIARKVTATITPCNKMAHAEQLEKPSKSTKSLGGIDISKEILNKFKKTEDIQIEIFKGEVKYFKQLHDKAKSKFNPENKPSGKKTFIPQTPTSGMARKPATPAIPKKTFTPATAPDKATAGTKVQYRPNKMKTGHQIYNDPETWKDDGKKKPVQNWKTKKSTEDIVIDLKKKKKKKKSFFESNVRKAITASCTAGAPSTLTGGAALQAEHLLGSKKKADKKKVLKSLAEEAWKNYKNKEELIEFIQEKQPDMTKSEVLAVAKTYSYLEQVKAEKKLEELCKTENKDNYHIEHGKEDSAVHTGGRVSLKHNGKEVGYMRYHNNKDHLVVQDIEISKEHRRKGLGTKMYVSTEKKHGKKFKPNKLQSKQGKAFWNQKNRPFGKNK